MQASEQRNQTDARRPSRVLPEHEQRIAEHLAHDGERSTDELTSSNYEAMCEAVSEAGIVSKQCRECHGLGFRELGPKAKAKWDHKIASADSIRKRDEYRRDRFEETICKGCGGSGYIVTERRRQASPCEDCGGIPGRRCKRCLGRGQVFLGEIDYRGVTTRCGRCRGCGEVFDENLQDVCQLCRGKSYTIPCTAFETGCSKKGKLPPGYEGGSHHETDAVGAGAAGGSICRGDEDEIATLGAGSQLLERVRRIDPIAALGLETFLGPVGDYWAGTQWGRGFSLWCHTDSGRELVRLARARPSHEDLAFRGAAHLARPDFILEAVRREHLKKKVVDLVVGDLIRKTDTEHRELLARGRRLLAEVAAA